MATYDDVRIMQALKKRYEKRSEEVNEYWSKKIEEERRRRKQKGAVADDPTHGPKGREAGKQDIGDIPYSVPWQAILQDQTGITVPINSYYTCPVCGMQYALDMPPERCLRCGCLSFLHRKRIVNLKK